MHCTVYVCHESSTDTFCAPCPTTPAPSARRRRDVDAADEEDDEGVDGREKRASVHDPVVKLVKAGPHQVDDGRRGR